MKLDDHEYIYIQEKSTRTMVVVDVKDRTTLAFRYFIPLPFGFLKWVAHTFWNRIGERERHQTTKGAREYAIDRIMEHLDA